MNIDEAIAHAREVATMQRNNEKLNRTLRNASPYINENCIKCAEEHEQLAKWLEQLKEYQQLEEQGLLTRLPYPLGTKYIYFVDEEDMGVYELDAEKIEVSMMPISKKVLYTIDCFEILFEDFGKIVFLTREEAEAKLKEWGGNNE